MISTLERKNDGFYDLMKTYISNMILIFFFLLLKNIQQDKKKQKKELCEESMFIVQLLSVFPILFNITLMKDVRGVTTSKATKEMMINSLLNMN